MDHKGTPWGKGMNDDLTRLTRQLDRLQSEYAHARRTVKQERVALTQAKEDVAHAEEAQQVVQGIAEAVQQRAHEQIAAVVSRCLEAVFGEEAYQFRIDFKQARGKTEAHLLFVRDGVVLDDPVGAVGGGVIDVSSFALRLASLILALPRKRRLLITDEPFKMLSRKYIPAVRELLLVLSKELDLQIIMTTHNKELMIGKVIEIGDQ